MNTDPVLVCHACPKHKFVRQGLMVCTVDGRDVREHAADRECPENLYPPVTAQCEHCWSPHHCIKDCPIAPDHTKAKATSGGCGCDGSQTADVTRPE